MCGEQYPTPFFNLKSKIDYMDEQPTIGWIPPIFEASPSVFFPSDWSIPKLKTDMNLPLVISRYGVECCIFEEDLKDMSCALK